MLLAACSGGQQKTAPSDSVTGILAADQPADSQPGEPTATWSVDGTTMTYGSHTYTMTGNITREYRQGATGRVTFTHVPADLQEFQTVYEQFLGKTSYGVCAMLPMAFELWGRNHHTGEQCLQLITTQSCYSEVMRELPRHMEASEHAPANDSYVQRCLPAALLEGATKENGYNPNQPYTVNVSIGRSDNWGQESEMLQGDVYALNIVTENAWNTPLRSVSTLLPWRGDQLYKVSSSPALYINIYAPRQDWNGLQ